ncbi:MAG: hypothetical protein QMC90_01100 [Dehalococcoidales bacterium]|nr:hypothetical protein [Dehalococcoidales bacterium]
MSNEIEELRTRLKAIEDSIKELKEMDLFIAKATVASVGPMEINIVGGTMPGEGGKAI